MIAKRAVLCRTQRCRFASLGPKLVVSSSGSLVDKQKILVGNVLYKIYLQWKLILKFFSWKKITILQAIYTTCKNSHEWPKCAQCGTSSDNWSCKIKMDVALSCSHFFNFIHRMKWREALWTSKNFSFTLKNLILYFPTVFVFFFLGRTIKYLEHP